MAKTKTAGTTKTKTKTAGTTKTKTKTAGTTKTAATKGVQKKASPLSVRRATRTAIPMTGSKAQRGLAVKDSTPQTIVGIDLGDRFSQTCFVATGSGEIFDRGSVQTTKEAFTARFGTMPRARIAFETGTHSPWISRLLVELGHEVLVAHARKVRLITQNDKKNDDLDAERLALLARADPRLLHPIKPREEASQIGLAMLKARDSVVRIRTVLINTVRGLLKATGCRLKKCEADVFHKRAEGNVPAAMQPAILPLLAQIGTLTASIRDYDAKVRLMAKEDFPESELLSQVQGVGELTALAYLLTIEDPRRFKDGGKVASYLGLVPKQDVSCTIDKQLRITKAGSTFVRRLLVTSAHYILGPFAQDSDLRRWGLQLCERGGKNGKKRAVVAVARKLAVLLRHLWLTSQVYDPLHNAKKQAAKAENKPTPAIAS